jgi:signal transduction histidine kinase
VLPFIIFENAMKYSPEKSQINCQFKTSGENLIGIEISNKAFLPDKEELPKLFNKKYRGRYSADIHGTGIGLFVAKLICDYNDVEINLNTHQDSIIDGKPYGDFVIVLKLK